jgi:hypothetical protein
MRGLRAPFLLVDRLISLIVSLLGILQRLISSPPPISSHLYDAFSPSAPAGENQKQKQSRSNQRRASADQQAQQETQIAVSQPASQPASQTARQPDSQTARQQPCASWPRLRQFDLQMGLWAQVLRSSQPLSLVGQPLLSTRLPEQRDVAVAAADADTGGAGATPHAALRASLP